MSTDAIKTIKVDKATHRRLRMLAASKDSTISQVVRDLSVMAQYAAEHRDKPKEKAS